MYYVPQGAIPAPIFTPMQADNRVIGPAISALAPVAGGLAAAATNAFSREPRPVLAPLIGGATTALTNWAGSVIPFQTGPVVNTMMSNAAPVPVPAYAPQGAIGSALGRMAGGYIGDHFGYKDIGAALGDLAGQFMPFEAGPGVVASPPFYAPQGAWGNFIQSAGNVVGGIVGGNTGRTIRDVSGPATLLPFSAGPAVVASQPVYAPQGFWGNAISTVGGAVGQVVGGTPGNIIRDITALGEYIPYQAGPGVIASQPGFAPQGIGGGIGGSMLGGWIGGQLGNEALGRAIGGVVGSTLVPFQAGRGTHVQYVQMPTENVVYH